MGSIYRIHIALVIMILNESLIIVAVGDDIVERLSSSSSVRERSDAKSALDKDFHIGGLFPIHSKGKNENNPCGSLLPNKGIQRLEAMFYALDQINANGKYWRISLGASVFDTCSSDTYALEQTLKFFRMPSFSSTCSPTEETRRVTAVIGAANSPVSESVASILRLFQVPQVSYASTSEALDDTEKYSYFFRVVPSDKFQIQVILDLLQRLSWTYVATVASKGEYGEAAVEHLIQTIKNDYPDICYVPSQLLPRSPQEGDYEALIDRILKFEKARTVVVFLNEEKLRLLLQIAEKKNAEFLWLGSDSWGQKFQVVLNLEPFVEGAITILPKRSRIPGFDEYFQSLNPYKNKRNKWFKEYWEKEFKCVMKSSADDKSEPLISQPKQKAICTGLEKSSTFKQEGVVPMVFDAVHVLAYAYRSMCIENGVCNNHHRRLNGVLLRSHVKNVTFTRLDPEGKEIVLHFDGHGNVPANYTIYQFRKIGGELEYSYVPIGEWNMHTRLNLWDKPFWNSRTSDGTQVRISKSSSCRDPCKPGEQRVNVGENRDCCSATCKPCHGDEYLPSPSSTCTSCQIENGYVPNENRTACMKSEPEFMGSDLGRPWALIPCLFSCIGLVLTLIASIVFLKHRETPLIMAMGRELCYVMLVGISLCFSFTFVVAAEPTRVSCGFLRVGLGFGLSTCYAAILTKTNRISRIFNQRQITKRPLYISPESQLVICLCLMFIQLTLSIMWLIIRPPEVQRFITDHPRALLVSCGVDSTSVLVGLIYNMILIVCCAVYAFKTRNIPSNFNEAKYISFTMYSTCIVWLAFLATYSSTSNDYKVQSAVLCMSVSLSGTVVLMCLFCPKLYIVQFHPEKNVKNPTTNTNSGSGIESTSGVRFVREDARANVLCPPSATSTQSSSYSQPQDMRNAPNLMHL